MKCMGKVFKVSIFVFCAAILFSLSGSVGYAAGEDADVEGLWLRIPEFPDDADVDEFYADDDGEVTYIRSIDDGKFVLGIFRMPAGDEMTPEKLKETIAESVTNRGGDADDIEFDAAADDFAEMLSYPCMTAEYEIGENEDTQKFAVIGVFTDKYVFLVQAGVAADSFDDYTDRTQVWLEGIKFVGGTVSGEDKNEGGEGRGDVFDDKTGENGGQKIDFVAAVYSLPEFRGVAWHIPAAGEYDLGSGFALPNDSVCSVAVCPGYRVTLYQHSRFGGESAEFEDSEEDLGERKRWASSLKVEQIEEPDPDLALAWFSVQSENGNVPEEIDRDAAAVAKALEIHSERIRRFQAAGEMNWYGTTKDAERVEAGGELIKIFSDLGVDMSDWEADTFARMMNNFYDWRKDLSVWDTACMILNVSPESFKQ
jgi:hypothetical protein